MPYIKKEARGKWQEVIAKIEKIIEEILPEEIDGELNYFISSILNRVYKPKYFNYNRAMGLLESIKQEFYRRKIAPYEDKKIKEHGDI